MKLKQIDLTNGRLPPDPNYIYFIDEDDPMGDIISMKRPQGAKHTDELLSNKKPKVWKIKIKKRGTPS